MAIFEIYLKTDDTKNKPTGCPHYNTELNGFLQQTGNA